jgi:hypothetical protein
MWPEWHAEIASMAKPRASLAAMARVVSVGATMVDIASIERLVIALLVEGTNALPVANNNE